MTFSQIHRHSTISTHTSWVSKRSEIFFSFFFFFKKKKKPFLPSFLLLTLSGLFRLVLEERPYSTVQEIVDVIPVEPNANSSFSFTCHHELRLEDCVVRAGEVLTILLLEQQEGREPRLRCRVEGRQGASSEVLLPISCCGQFYEHKNSHAYSLRTIVAKPRLLNRHFYHLSAKVSGGPFRISPIYQVQAIMHLRKNVVNFPSSLEVDVVDVTEQSRDITFVTPLTLAEVMSQPQQSFPTMAEVLEGLEAKPLLKCHWSKGLQKGQQLVLHGCRDSAMVLASTLPGKRAQQHFLISLRYGGRLRLRPREFAAVYELHVAARRMPGLTVTASKHSETLEEGLNSLSAGDQLEVLRSQTVELPGDGRKQVTEVLVCRRLLEKSEEVYLPMYLEGPFVEKIKDKKKYSLANMIQRFALPLDVKVATRDTDLQSDPLADFPALRLKEAVMEPVVVASLPSKPLECFELPSRWLKLALCLSEDPLPWAKRPPPKVCCETVIELTEAFYYEFHKLSGECDAPPPLPPKRPVEPLKQTSRTTAKDKKKSPLCHSGSPHTEMHALKLSAENVSKRPPPPPLPPAPVNKHLTYMLHFAPPDKNDQPSR
uniref:Thymocyte selection associated family member 2 n=1 Tax=Scleropages formosus TaxID=113540 RepID=A0A8C9VMS9_SCLFO